MLYMHAYIPTYTRPRTRTHTRTHAHAHAHAYAYAHAHTHAHARTHIHTHTHLHTRPGSRTGTQSCRLIPSWLLSSDGLYRGISVHFCGKQMHIHLRWTVQSAMPLMDTKCPTFGGRPFTLSGQPDRDECEWSTISVLR